MVHEKTFENFVVDEENRLAYEVAVRVCHSENTLPNLIIFYSSSPSGKSHLLKAIYNECNQMDRRAIYIDAEHFLNEYVEHMVSQTMNDFRNKYLQNDILLFDRFDDILQKYEAQKQLSKFIESYKDYQKRIVISMTRHPSREAFIASRLKNLLLQGLCIEIKEMERDAINDLIFHKSRAMGLRLDNNMIQCISKCRSLPKIEGILHKADAVSKILEEKIDIGLIKRITEEFETEEKEVK
jgi:chromosomal replication initiator protein